MLSQTQRDYKWSLVYSGKDKAYHITEHRLVDGDWVKIGSSSWGTLNSALNHIEVSNEERMKEVRP